MSFVSQGVPGTVSTLHQRRLNAILALEKAEECLVVLGTEVPAGFDRRFIFENLRGAAAILRSAEEENEKTG